LPGDVGVRQQRLLCRRWGRVLLAAKNNSPDSLFRPWQEKCSSRTSSGRLSENRSSMCSPMTCAGSLRTTRTSKPPISGSPSTRPSASASAPPRREQMPQPSCSYRVVGNDQRPCAARPPSAPAPGVALHEKVDDAVLLGRRHLRELQHIAINLNLDRPTDPVAARQPSPDRRDDVREACRGPAEADHESAERHHVDCPCTRRHLTCLRQRDIVDVQLQKFRAQISDERAQPFGVSTLLGRWRRTSPSIGPQSLPDKRILKDHALQYG
jgi:hypothetical protein